MTRWRLLALLVLSVLVQPAQATVHALVIGIDNYAHKQALRGSLNDASDLIAVLEAAPDTTVTSLLDATATRAAFDATWQDLVHNAASGDTLLLSFSGHGIRVPEEDGRPTAADGYEKGFLLHGYDEGDEARQEILRDEYLYDLFKAADDKGIRVVFIADACHAGAAVRGTDPRAVAPPFRFQRFETEPAVHPETGVEVVRARPPIAGLTVFAATVEEMAVHEVLVDGAYRGALSYAIARGLEGAASNGEGTVTAQTLRDFVTPLVRLLSQNRQIPQSTVPEPGRLILPVSDMAAAPATLPDDISVNLLPPAEPDLDMISGALLVPAGEAADLTWDPSTSQLLGQSGDVLGSNVASSAVQDAVDTVRVLAALRDMVTRQPGPVRTTIEPSTPFLLAGQAMRYTTDLGDFAYPTVINLNARGVVQFVWPLQQLGDPVHWTSTGPLTFDAPVTEPFGADFVVTILSRAPLLTLHGQLSAMHGTVAPLALFDAVRAAWTSTDLRIGIVSVFTCKSLRSNGQCDSMQPSL